MQKKGQCGVLCSMQRIQGWSPGRAVRIETLGEKNGKFESKTCGKRRCLKWEEGFKVVD